MADYVRINPKNNTIFEVSTFPDLRKRYAKQAALSQQLPVFYIETSESISSRKLARAENVARPDAPCKEPKQQFDVWMKVVDEAPGTDEAHKAVPGSIQFVDGIFRRVYQIQKKTQHEIGQMEDARREQKRRERIGQLLPPDTLYSLIGLVQAIAQSPAVREHVTVPDNLVEFIKKDE